MGYTVQGVAKCCICHESPSQVLYFPYSTRQWLIFCMGWRQLIVSSRISFNLLLFVSLFVVKLGKKLSLKDPGPLDLTIINWFVRESFTSHIAQVTKPYLQIGMGQYSILSLKGNIQLGNTDIVRT